MWPLRKKQEPAKEDRLHVLAQSISNHLNEARPGWIPNGPVVEGPGTLEVRVAALHDADSTGHADIGFVLNRDDAQMPVLWDCASGWGDTVDEQMEVVARIWATSTLPAVAEFIWSQRGEYADHYHDGDAGGLPGYHVIHGPVIGYGQPELAEQLQQWWISHPLLPVIGSVLRGSLTTDEPTVHGLKLFVGGGEERFAEVRLNGAHHDDASKALAGLPWPATPEFACARAYVLVLHAEDAG